MLSTFDLFSQPLVASAPLTVDLLVKLSSLEAVFRDSVHPVVQV